MWSSPLHAHLLLLQPAPPIPALPTKMQPRSEKPLTSVAGVTHTPQTGPRGGDRGAAPGHGTRRAEPRAKLRPGPERRSQSAGRGERAVLAPASRKIVFPGTTFFHFCWATTATRAEAALPPVPSVQQPSRQRLPGSVLPPLGLLGRREEVPAPAAAHATRTPLVTDGSASPAPGALPGGGCGLSLRRARGPGDSNSAGPGSAIPAPSPLPSPSRGLPLRLLAATSVSLSLGLSFSGPAGHSGKEEEGGVGRGEEAARGGGD